MSKFVSIENFLRHISCQNIRCGEENHETNCNNKVANAVSLGEEQKPRCTLIVEKTAYLRLILNSSFFGELKELLLIARFGRDKKLTFECLPNMSTSLQRAHRIERHVTF
jgi:hypothetical protein